MEDEVPEYKCDDSYEAVLEQKISIGLSQTACQSKPLLLKTDGTLSAGTL